ncbi:hypothetical protein DENSPDRAFT_676571 [Dentipellis sp. KUC8613]|nr:hypothetical protein DENSPDRAFT_676571 [Dentipellis sp. KUC8613]
MPVAPVDDKGTVLFYTDTGPLEGTYLTIVLVHGTAIHGGIFARMLPHAKENRLRLVVVNRRDYPGSTRLTDEELQALASPDAETRAEYFRQRALEFGEFLAWFVQNEKIPLYTITDNGKPEGGIVLLGWSSATTSILGLLAFPDRVPEKTREILEPYFRAMCLYDTPRWSYGIPDPQGFYHPLRDTARPVEERAVIFQSWVSGYYAHPDIHSGDVSTLTQESLKEPPPSMDAMTPEEKDGVSQKDAAERSETLVVNMSPPTFYAQIDMALKEETAWLWPRCKIRTLWCQQSLWEMVSANWEVNKLYKAKKEKGEKVRVLESTPLPGANHFLHWDKPDLACQLFASTL